MCPRYYTKQHQMKLQFWRSWEWGVSLYCHYSQVAVWPGVVECVTVSSMRQIDFFKNHFYSIGLCKKKTLQKQLHKIRKYEYTMNNFIFVFITKVMPVYIIIKSMQNLIGSLFLNITISWSGIKFVLSIFCNIDCYIYFKHFKIFEIL